MRGNFVAHFRRENRQEESVVRKFHERYRFTVRLVYPTNVLHDVISLIKTGLDRTGRHQRAQRGVQLQRQQDATYSCNRAWK